ncbi:MAG: C4-dicarboxylate ABC transporter [Chloroflexota bacterium]|nr:MAG: C4-dicarboxylate ABC transporter [Chloroflexota bacterium]
MTIVKDAARTLHPAYFAMVMATGIISIAALLLGLIPIAFALFWLNLAMYGGLWTLALLRLLWFADRLAGDLLDHNRGVGFFTLVAATSVMGSQFVLIAGNSEVAKYLWFLALFLWIGLIYVIFTGFTIKETKPELERGINGAWLTAVVATQSLCVLGGLLVPQFAPYQQEVLLFALTLWLLGSMLYIWVISLIFYRYIFFPFLPSDLTPPYWINMGATAISVLAGSTLIANASQSALLQQMRPFLEGFTLFYWATGTWWIPMLVILFIWRHVYKKFKFSYDPLYWGAVFPLGMYTVCTLRLSAAVSFPSLLEIPRYFVFVALLAWTATFLGLLHFLGSKVLKLASHGRAPA